MDPDSKKRSVVVWSWCYFVKDGTFFGDTSLYNFSTVSDSTTTGSELSKEVYELSCKIMEARYSTFTPSAEVRWIRGLALLLSVTAPLITFPYKSTSAEDIFLPVFPERTTELARIIIFPAPPF